MAKAKLTRQEEQMLKKNMEDEKKRIIREKEQKQQRIQTEYDKIINTIQTSARKLKDDELSELHTRLQKFFNKII